MASEKQKEVQGAAAPRLTPEVVRAPRNPNCTAENGKPCAFCDEDWWVPNHLSTRAIPTSRCLQEPGLAAPRRTEGAYYCPCNHCFRARATQRDSEKRAAPTLADALEQVAIPTLRYCEVTYGLDDQARVNLEAALREAGRLP